MRRSLLARLVLLSALALSACNPTLFIQREFTPGQLKSGARVHAYQAAAIGFSSLNGLAMQWEAALVAVDQDLVPFLQAIAKSQYRYEVEIVSRTHSDRDIQFEYYDVSTALVRREPELTTAKTPTAKKTPDRFPIPGARLPDSYFQSASEATQIPAPVLRKGNEALLAVVGLMAPLNVSDEIVRKYAFGLLCLREKLKAGEQADYLAPMRPAQESQEDILVALRVVSDQHATAALWRTEGMGLLAMAGAYENPVATNVLQEQAKDSLTSVQQWRASHHQPTPEEYGVAMKEFKLPTPEAMLEALDKDGYLTAAIQVAKGVVTGSPSATIEGFGKLAPKNSTFRIAADGVAAALRGDIKGTVVAVASLAGKEAQVTQLQDRLKRLQGAVGDLKSHASDPSKALPDPLRKRN